ncbi:hypothetical protein EJ110_NYTH10335 [Nymphaea thermarum]|nr:hypothetical protein EJ110_NYTH10335 [Nymphaea thermarum]
MGQLPIKYLGVPLQNKRLSEGQCMGTTGLDFQLTWRLSSKNRMNVSLTLLECHSTGVASDSEGSNPGMTGDDGEEARPRLVLHKTLEQALAAVSAWSRKKESGRPTSMKGQGFLS